MSDLPNVPGSIPAGPLEPLLVDSRTAAAALSVCERTLWRLVEEDGLPVVRVRRRVLFEPRALREWIAARSKSGAEARA